MSRLTSWFRSGESRASLDERPTSKEEVMAKEMADIEEAFAAAELIMNDDLEGASERLQKGNSCYHMLTLAVINFMRSVLGFEKEIIGQASTQLSDCETRALADMRRAQQDFAGYPGMIYPPGAEYSLVLAEAQLMSAVVGVLHESLTEGIKSFYKLRKAFYALQGIVHSENRPWTQGQNGRKLLLSDAYLEDKMPGSFGDDEFCDDARSCSDSDQDFVDATDGFGIPGTAGNEEHPPEEDGAPTEPNHAFASSRQSCAGAPVVAANKTNANGVSSIELFTNPRDIFIHSGTTMCFGTLLFIFTMVPPAFSKILHIIGFKGDREKGIRMLWESTRFTNVHGAVAGLVLLAYYNGLIGYSDILPTDDYFDSAAEIVGFPAKKCEALLANMKTRYPQSGLWRMEESRMHANSRRLHEAIACLKDHSHPKMKQVAAINNFELAADAMFIQDWNLMRDSFLACRELNNWSHAMYYYLAGSAELELYRDAVHSQPPDHDEARRRKKKAEELFRKVPTVAGRKKLLARQLPFEQFILRKFSKWEERVKELDIDLADVIGVSPASEMLYLWNGPKRMDVEQATRALRFLEWGRCTAGSEEVERIRQVPDEVGSRAVCRSALLRTVGRIDEAKEALETEALTFDRSQLKGPTKDDWILPCAHHEMAVIAWYSACSPAADNEKPLPGLETCTSREEYRREKVEECQKHLEKVAQWETFVLEGRIGMRVQTALETLNWFRKRMGWS